MKIIDINTLEIEDWESFHAYFSKKFYFPEYYGYNMDAWIDCMSHLDDSDGIIFSKLSLKTNDSIVLNLLDIDSFISRVPDIYNALIECSAFLNYRRIEDGYNALIFLSFHKNQINVG
jgi:RNAse (barnase) inhibitor barstar